MTPLKAVTNGLATRKVFSGTMPKVGLAESPTREQEAAKERTGLWNIEPRVSPDGKYIGRLDRYTVKVSRYEPESVRAFTGQVPRNPSKAYDRDMQSFRVPYRTFDHGWDFVPGQDALVLTGREENYPRGLLQETTGLTFELDGYDWNQLYVFKYPPLQEYKFGNDILESRTALKGFKKRTFGRANGKKSQTPSVVTTLQSIPMATALPSSSILMEPSTWRPLILMALTRSI